MLAGEFIDLAEQEGREPTSAERKEYIDQHVWERSCAIYAAWDHIIRRHEIEQILTTSRGNTFGLIEVFG